MALPDCIAELEAFLGTYADAIEGFDDINHMDVANDTRTAVNDFRTSLLELVGEEGLIQKVLPLLREIVKRGFPNVPKRPVPQELLDNIEEQIKTITAAKAMLVLAEPEPMATDLGIKPGIIRKK